MPRPPRKGYEPLYLNKYRTISDPQGKLGYPPRPPKPPVRCEVYSFTEICVICGWRDRKAAFNRFRRSLAGEEHVFPFRPLPRTGPKDRWRFSRAEVDRYLTPTDPGYDHPEDFVTDAVEDRSGDLDPSDLTSDEVVYDED